MSLNNVPTQNEETGKAEEAFNYDDIMKYIGQMGKFQLRSCILLMIPGFFPGIVVLSYTFTGGIPRYRCLIDECEDRTSSVFEPSWLNRTIPWGLENSISQCNRYNQTLVRKDQLECQSLGAYDPKQLELCDEWVYDQSVFKSTIVTDFNLTCEDEWKQTLVGTVYMIGMVLGAVILGNIADIVGRKLAFSVNCFVLATAMTASAFSPDLLTFAIFRFICGICETSHFLIAFVWGVEAAGQDYRVIVGSMYQVTYGLGSATLGLIAYYVREWRTLQLIISVPIFIPVALYWIVPESTRWLIIRKRYEKARHLILKAAKMNKKTVPEHLLIIPVTEESVETSQIQTISKATKNVTAFENEKSENILGIFRSRLLCGWIFVMTSAWIGAAAGYYGLTFSASNLSGSIHLNFVLSVLVEIPAYLFGLYAMDKVGRRTTLSTCYLLSGIACLITGFVPEDPTTIRIVFSLLGKFFVSTAYAGVFTYTSEIFPTPARSAALGFCSTCGKIGGVLAPIITSIGRTSNPALPFVVFASIEIVVGLLCLLLPETNLVPLPSTIREAENLKKYTLSCFRRGHNG